MPVSKQDRMPVPPVRALFGVFFARFFESETTVGPSDLRQSLLWLIGCLAAPGVFWGFWQSFRWQLIAMMHGEEALRLAVLFDKTLYLSFTAIAIGLVACVAWPSLVIDRRDALILGVWPVRLRSIVLGKLAALAAYIGIIAGGMHAGSALMFGTLLGAGSPIGTARATLGHFVSAVAISLFVFGGIAALATVTLAIAGPRRFQRLSGALQIACVAIVTTGLVLLPAISGSTVRTIRGDAAQTLGAVIVVLLAAYPIACRRVLAATSGRAVAASRPWSRTLGTAVVRWLARVPSTRATLQFIVATIGRIQSHRLMLAIAMGIALTICVPVLLAALSPVSTREPGAMVVPLLAIGPTLMFFAAAGLRVAMAMPAELPARWLFASAPMPAGAGRTAARRLMWLAAVAPGAVITAVIATALWHFGWALVAAAAVAAAGALLTEIHLWGFVGVPCARPLAPGSAKMQSRWPLYMTGLYLISVLLPTFIAGAHDGRPIAWLLVLIVPLAIAARLGSERAAAVNAVSELDEDSLLLLDLSVPAPQKVTTNARGT
jgi:hypothetical protein